MLQGSNLKHILIALCFLPCAAVSEAALQSLEEITHSAEDYVYAELAGEDVNITVKNPDSRLRLQQCEAPLNIFWAPGARRYGATSVGVACEGEKPWKIFLRLTVQAMREVAVADRPLIRGDVLQMGDVRFEKRDISRMHSGYITDITPLVGYEVRQPISSNALLRARMFAPPELVKRGQRVTVIAAVGGLEVRVAGEALSDGGKGAMIRVRNLSSKRIIQGEVIAKGLVRVTM